MLDANKLKHTLLTDLKVELYEEFDLNFGRKAFFSDKWKPRAFPYRRGSLMSVSNNLRRSINAEVVRNGVRFTSAKPYATSHNEGAKIQVTPRMKKFFWAKYISTKQDMWKFMALKKRAVSLNCLSVGSLETAPIHNGLLKQSLTTSAKSLVYNLPI